jgi:hypothetical protein
MTSEKTKHRGLLIAVAGLSGSGKSTLAGRLVAEFNAASSSPADWLRNDVVRKELAGIPVDQTLPAEFYSSAFSKKTYAEFDRRMLEALGQGRIVFADGVFLGEKRREELKSLAESAGANFIGLWLDTPPEIMKARAEARKGTGDASDADSKVIDIQLAADLGKITWDRLDAGGTAENTYRQAAAVLKKRGLTL